tara:strand:- start:530 stop:1021 length:492 start_codon:yes stop_codon:yes gene_type:complete
MAVVNTKATALTNADAKPAVFTGSYIAGGRLRQMVGTVAVLAADSDGSTYRVARIWSGWRIASIRLFNTAIADGSVFDVGLYETDDGAAADDDVYATGVALTSASTTGTEVAFEQRGIQLAGNRVFEDLEETSDPHRWYDLVLTGDTVGTGDGTITVMVTYVD